MLRNKRNRIDTVFDHNSQKGGKVFMPFITAGDPSLKDTEQLVAAMCRGGADIIELGVPFSDPLADGPVIQRAAGRALKNGVSLRDVFDLVSRLRENNTLADRPVVLLLYYNIVYAYGEEKFIRDAVSAGVDGAVIPDLPLEAGGDLRRIGQAAGFSLIAMITPATGADRIGLIAQQASGFIYYTAVTGVTGKRDKIRGQLAGEIKRVKDLTELPVLLGFGIANKQQAEQAAGYADGVIIGSALVELVERYHDEERCIRVQRFIKDIKEVV